MNRTVFLVGARAAGKTTVGSALARGLGCFFVDTDQYLLETTSRTVASLVAEEGWDGFRSRECVALRTVTAPETVIATGGGMVLSESNRTFMHTHGTVFYLYAPASLLSERLTRVPEMDQRPSLTDRSLSDEVRAVLALRDPLYRQVAHHVLDASAPLQCLVEQAVRLLRAS